jgi:hypothetical protein
MIQFYVDAGKIYPIQAIDEIIDISLKEENLIYFNLAKELLEHYGKVKKEDITQKAVSIVKEISNISDAVWEGDYAMEVIIND